MKKNGYKKKKLWKRGRVGYGSKKKSCGRKTRGSTVYMDVKRRRRMKHGCKKKENSGRETRTLVVLSSRYMDEQKKV